MQQLNLLMQFYLFFIKQLKIIYVYRLEKHKT